MCNGVLSGKLKFTASPLSECLKLFLLVMCKWLKNSYPNCDKIGDFFTLHLSPVNMSFILNFEIVVEIDNDIPLLTISCFPYLS